MSPLILGEMLGLFVNTLATDGGYPVPGCEDLPTQIKCSSMNNEKLLLNFLYQFCNIQQILNILEKNMIVIANKFLKLETVKILVRPLSKKHRFRTRFDSEPCERVPNTSEIFMRTLLSFSPNLIWKMSPLVLGEILGVFLNILTSKYPLQGC